MNEMLANVVIQTRVSDVFILRLFPAGPAVLISLDALEGSESKKCVPAHFIA